MLRILEGFRLNRKLRRGLWLVIAVTLVINIGCSVFAMDFGDKLQQYQEEQEQDGYDDSIGNREGNGDEADDSMTFTDVLKGKAGGNIDIESASESNTGRGIISFLSTLTFYILVLAVCGQFVLTILDLIYLSIPGLRPLMFDVSKIGEATAYVSGAKISMEAKERSLQLSNKRAAEGNMVSANRWMKEANYWQGRINYHNAQNQEALENAQGRADSKSKANKKKIQLISDDMKKLALKGIINIEMYDPRASLGNTRVETNNKLLVYLKARVKTILWMCVCVMTLVVDNTFTTFGWGVGLWNMGLVLFMFFFL